MTNQRGQNVSVGSIIAWGPLESRADLAGVLHMVSAHMGVVQKITGGARPGAIVAGLNGTKKRITANTIRLCRVLGQLTFDGYAAKGLA